MNALAFRLSTSDLSFATFVIISLIIALAVAISVVDILWVARAFLNASWPKIWPVHLLRLGVAFLHTTLYLPALLLLIDPLRCNYAASPPVLARFEHIECTSLAVIALIAVRYLAALSLFVCASLLALVNFQESPTSSHILARPHSRVEALLHLAKTAIALITVLVPGPLAIAYAVTLLAAAAAVVLFRFLPHYSVRVTAFRTGTYAAVASLGLVAIVRLHLSPKNPSAQLNMLFLISLAAPVFGYLVAGAATLRRIASLRASAAAFLAAQSAISPRSSASSDAPRSSSPSSSAAPGHTFATAADVELLARAAITQTLAARRSHSTAAVRPHDGLHVSQAVADISTIYTCGVEQYPNSPYLMLTLTSLMASLGEMDEAHSTLDVLRRLRLAHVAHLDHAFGVYRKTQDFIRRVHAASISASAPADSGSAPTTAAFDLLTYIRFNENLRVAQTQHARALSAVAHFWSLLHVPDARAADRAVFLARADAHVADIRSAALVADARYRSLVRSHPDSLPLLVSYAHFLEDVRHDLKRAHVLYSRAAALARADNARRAAATLERASAPRGATNLDGHGAAAPAAAGERISTFSQINDAVDAVLTIARDGTVTWCNANALSLLGYSLASHLVGRNISVIVPPPFDLAHDAFLARYHTTGKAHILGRGRRKLEAVDASGVLIPIFLSVTALDGTTEASLGTAYVGVLAPRDVAGEILYLAPVGPDGALAVIAASPDAPAVFNLASHAILLSISPAALLPALADLVAAADSQGPARGKVCPVSAAAAPLVSGAVIARPTAVRQANSTDSASSVAMARIQKMEAGGRVVYKLELESLSDAVAQVVVSRDGRILQAGHPLLAAMVGLPEAALLGKPITNLLSVAHDAQPGHVTSHTPRAVVAQLASAPAFAPLPLHLITSDGELVPAAASASRLASVADDATASDDRWTIALALSPRALLTPSSHSRRSSAVSNHSPHGSLGLGRSASIDAQYKAARATTPKTPKSLGATPRTPSSSARAPIAVPSAAHHARRVERKLRAPGSADQVMLLRRMALAGSQTRTRLCVLLLGIVAFVIAVAIAAVILGLRVERHAARAAVAAAKPASFAAYAVTSVNATDAESLAAAHAAAATLHARILTGAGGLPALADLSGSGASAVRACIVNPAPELAPASMSLLDVEARLLDPNVPLGFINATLASPGVFEVMSRCLAAEVAAVAALERSTASAFAIVVGIGAGLAALTLLALLGPSVRGAIRNRAGAWSLFLALSQPAIAAHLRYLRAATRRLASDDLSSFDADDNYELYFDEASAPAATPPLASPRNEAMITRYYGPPSNNSRFGGPVPRVSFRLPLGSPTSSSSTGAAAAAAALLAHHPTANKRSSELPASPPHDDNATDNDATGEPPKSTSMPLLRTMAPQPRVAATGSALLPRHGNAHDRNRDRSDPHISTSSILSVVSSSTTGCPHSHMCPTSTSSSPSTSTSSSASSAVSTSSSSSSSSSSLPRQNEAAVEMMSASNNKSPILVSPMASPVVSPRETATAVGLSVMPGQRRMAIMVYAYLCAIVAAVVVILVAALWALVPLLTTGYLLPILEANGSRWAAVSAGKVALAGNAHQLSRAEWLAAAEQAMLVAYTSRDHHPLVGQLVLNQFYAVHAAINAVVDALGTGAGPAAVHIAASASSGVESLQATITSNFGTNMVAIPFVVLFVQLFLLLCIYTAVSKLAHHETSKTRFVVHLIPSHLSSTAMTSAIRTRHPHAQP
ncbi:uncharacterized protein AMSG_11128 [Thecamonas trahens ATCC 50062]|uniref:Uncharacterized protein n=1 Tax=Thecamonas trahens ATCC 50062 TaxID=461836 RepID=A0A0L0DU63_THETB|nr:hypothetical protein AMSG_11128 [Thecamonas trahens ATCC 50062]KNC55732.1 hypothetical protein AMSG_11128 [Thecamonas trahens ATCC 50062]|eukprot:XP_013752887.1 hypothetical protein AMSG_11128 [Thecamonas trahens ATCC 50062]